MKNVLLLLCAAILSCNSTPTIKINNVECGFSNGTHHADVHYTNPDTGTKKYYDLDIEVKECYVIKIIFPKGGWLDESHIHKGKLDERGHTSITDDKGRVWVIDITD